MPTQTLITKFRSAFILLLLIVATVLIAWLSTRYSFGIDWTASQRNTLSETSIKVLEVLDKPVRITVYATDDESVRRPIQDLLDRYLRFYSEIDVQFINPDVEPALVRKQNITTNGEIVLQYAGRSKNLKRHTEETITNALQGLSRSELRWMVFLTGHGERAPHGEANHDVSDWVKQLDARGINAQSHNLALNPRIPDNAAVLVIASPQVDLLAGETDIIREYVKTGGNLLWFAEPDTLGALEPLAEQLGITFLNGTILDPTTQAFGINDPRFAIVPEYPLHPITKDFKVLTLYPQARAISINPGNQWKTTPLMTSLKRSWAENGPLTGTAGFDAETDIRGPLIVGLAMSRSRNNSGNTDNESDNQQRIMITGDGDFLSNAYLGNGGNLQLGLLLANWLSEDDRLLSIPAKTASDIQLTLSPLLQGLIAFGFLLGLPALLTGTGFVIWRRRRNL